MKSSLAIIRLELARLPSNRQGLFYLFAFVFFWYLLQRFVIFNMTDLLTQHREGDDSWFTTVFSTYFQVGLYLFPLLCLFIAANQTGGDRERGTLRFLLLYCNRDSIFFGRFLAQVVIQYSLILLTLLSTLVFGLYYDAFTLSVLQTALIMGANLAIALLPFIALMALLSAMVKSPRQATVLASLIWMLASGILSGLSYYFPFLAPVELLVPGMQFSLLSNLQGAALFALAYIPLLQTVLLLLAGRFVMQRAAL